MRPRVHRSNLQYLGHERHCCLRLLFLSFSQHNVVDCARDNGFAMTETENDASKICMLGEAEHLRNFGKWYKPDYLNCCKSSLLLSDPSQLQPPVPAGELQDGAVLHFPSADHANVEVCVLPVPRVPVYDAELRQHGVVRGLRLVLGDHQQ